MGASNNKPQLNKFAPRPNALKAPISRLLAGVIYDHEMKKKDVEFKERRMMEVYHAKTDVGLNGCLETRQITIPSKDSQQVMKLWKTFDKCAAGGGTITSVGDFDAVKIYCQPNGTALGTLGETMIRIKTKKLSSREMLAIDSYDYRKE